MTHRLPGGTGRSRGHCHVSARPRHRPDRPHRRSSRTSVRPGHVCSRSPTWRSSGSPHRGRALSSHEGRRAVSGEGAGRGALAPPSPHTPPSPPPDRLPPSARPPSRLPPPFSLAQARGAISGMPAAHFTVASSVAAASLAVRGRRTVCAYLLEGLQPHRGGLSQATTECYTDIADESAVRRCVTAPWVPPIQALE